MTNIEFGVEWCLQGEPVFVAGGYTREGAEQMVARCSGEGWSHTARVVTRHATKWTPVGGGDE
jgi:hypothetical protein